MTPSGQILHNSQGLIGMTNNRTGTYITTKNFATSHSKQIYGKHQEINLARFVFTVYTLEVMDPAKTTIYSLSLQPDGI